MDICGTDACVMARCLKSGDANRYQETNVEGALEPDASCLAGGRALHHPETDEIVAVVGTMRDNSAEVRMHKRYGAMLDAERNRKEILEKEVALRTSELVEANATLNKTNSDLAASRREVTDILENISQAILTIDENLCVGQEYSKYAERVFGRESLHGVEFAELLSPVEEQSREHKELIEWLKLVFHSPTLDWDMAKSMIQDEYKLDRHDGRVSELKIEFEPIREEQRVKRLMVLVEDLTETRELQRAIDAKQQEMDDSLDHLSELAQLDPELYEAIFEEAIEIVERSAASLVKLRDAEDPSAVIDQMFRDMHTLKGNAMSFGMVRVAAKAHWVEDAFSKLRESVGAITEELVVETEEKVRELGDLFERIQSMASRVLNQATPKDTGAVRSLDRDMKIEVDVERLNALVAWAEENILGHTKSKELLTRVRSLALVPLSRLYGRFPKMIDDLAESLGKKINPIELEGADIALDAKVFNMIGNVLVHLLRNCMDHGIEAPEVRMTAGRSAYGTIRLRTFYEGDRLCMEVRDDGAGIDGEKLVRRAHEKGLLTPSETPTGQEALQIIFMPGFSTVEVITDTSGRGVGMDAVKSLLTELGGNIRIETRIGSGTTFHMWIPTESALGPTDSV